MTSLVADGLGGFFFVLHPVGLPVLYFVIDEIQEAPAIAKRPGYGESSTKWI